jgi:hypothetical protein
MTITATERIQRKRHVLAGDWDDAILQFANGARVWARRSTLDNAGHLCVESTDADGMMRIDLFDLADVVRVTR